MEFGRQGPFPPWDTHESARTIQRALYCPLLDAGQLDVPSGASWVWSCPVKCLVLRAHKPLLRCDVSLRGAGLYSQRHACSRPVGVRPALRHGSTAGQDPGKSVQFAEESAPPSSPSASIASRPAAMAVIAHHRHCHRWTTQMHGLEQPRHELDEPAAAGRHRRQSRYCRQTATTVNPDRSSIGRVAGRVPGTAKPSQAKQPRARTSPRHVAAQPPLVAARRRSPPLVAARRGSPPLVAARRRCRPAPHCQVNSSRECCSTPLDRICYSPTLVAVIAAVRAARFGAWGGGAEAADAPHAAHSTSPPLEPLEGSRLV